MASGARVVLQNIPRALVHVPSWVLYGAGILFGLDMLFGLLFGWTLALRILGWFRRGAYKK